jgi:threonylcarbamoyladenosine tRNA methylthiotransferase MtaB
MSRTEALGYAVTSLGCKVSRIDALAWGASLERSGWKRVDEAQADVIVVQTCTVTGRADRDGRKLIRSLARENPLAAVVATGCLGALVAGIFHVTSGPATPALQRVSVVDDESPRTARELRRTVLVASAPRVSRHLLFP